MAGFLAALWESTAYVEAVAWVVVRPILRLAADLRRPGSSELLQHSEQSAPVDSSKLTVLQFLQLQSALRFLHLAVG